MLFRFPVIVFLSSGLFFRLDGFPDHRADFPLVLIEKLGRGVGRRSRDENIFLLGFPDEDPADPGARAVGGKLRGRNVEALQIDGKDVRFGKRPVDSGKGSVARLVLLHRDGHERGKFHFQRFAELVHQAAHPEHPAGNFQPLGVGHRRQIEFLGQLRPDLRRFTVGGIRPAQDEVVARNFFCDGAAQHERRGVRIGAGQEPVAHQKSPVRAHGERFAQNLLRRGRSHGDDRDRSGAVGLDPKRGLHSVPAGRVHHPRRQIAAERPGLFIPGQFGDHRHLLDAYHNIQHRFSFLTISASSEWRGR